MPNKSNLRHTIATYVILFYFLPLLFLVLASTRWIGLSSWLTLVFGLLIASSGSIGFILVLWQWKNSLPLPLNDVGEIAEELEDVVEEVLQPTEEELEALRQVQLLQAELEETQLQWKTLNDTIAQKEEECECLKDSRLALEDEFEQMREDFTAFQEESFEQLKQKELLLAEYANTVQELRDSIEKKQQQVSKLESSVSDLTFEVKTLIQLSDVEKGVKEPTFAQPASYSENESTHRKIYKPSFQQTVGRPAYSADSVETTTLTRHEHETRVRNQQEASTELRKCIEIAQKITGASHLAASGRIPFGIDSYALDQRRLYDGLRTEIRALVIVYSPRDDKLLFANAQVKALLGWSPERFIQDFNMLIKEGFEDWKRVVIGLAAHQEAQVRLLVKTRIGHDQILQGRLGMIPFGSFKGHIIAVFFTG